MKRDLVNGEDEVHVAARHVLDFWFDMLMPEQHFAKDEAIDSAIAARFTGLCDQLPKNGAAGWRDDPDTLLAAIIVLDQFRRNLHRGTADAYHADPLALELTHQAIAKGWDREMPKERRAFLYMPLMHAEDMAEQRLSVACFENLGMDTQTAFARDHAAVIAQYGRFPSRNAALGRVSTDAEREYLSRPDAGW